MRKNSGKTSTGILAGVVIVCAIVAGGLALWQADFTGRDEDKLGSGADYNLDKFLKTDPKLIIYRELTDRGFDTAFKEPISITIAPEGLIYIVGDQMVRVFDSGGKKQWDKAIAPAPRCMAVDADDTYYVASRSRVQVFAPDGNLRSSWADAGEKAVFTSIAIYGDNVFVADFGNRIVLRYNKSGELINRIGAKSADRGIEGFNIPSAYFDLAIDSDGLVRVANTGRHRIEAFTPEGDLRSHWLRQMSAEIKGFSGCCNPANFAITPGGEFITAEKGITRVKVYDDNGEFVGVVAGAESFSSHDKICASKGEDGGCDSGALDVAVDSQGLVYVLDPYTARVRVFVRKDSADGE